MRGTRGDAWRAQRRQVALLLLGAGLMLAACERYVPELGQADYSARPDAVRCAPDARPGVAGASDGFLSEPGVRVNVRTPRNYDPTIGHPLLMVFAAAGQRAGASERFLDLTRAATAQGFIVAYTDHRGLSRHQFSRLARVPQALAAQWCVDTARVYATGHSDGGLAAQAVVFLAEAPLRVSGLVASGAGIRAGDLAAYPCAQPLPVMIIHSREDKLFPPPEYGRGAADWWAACNQCGALSEGIVAGSCREYLDCDAGAPTRYCEVEGSHRASPGLDAALLAFLAAQD